MIKLPLRHFATSPVIKDLFLCLLSGCLLIFSFPNFNLWLFAWFGFVPLFFAIQNKRKFKAFLLSYFTGLIFWFGTIYWLIHVTFPGLVLLVLYLALYFGIFGLLISFYPLSAIRYPLIYIPCLWVLLEYLRSYLFTGFGWALLGYSQFLNLPVIQIADITGVWGVSFLVMMVNVVIWQLMNVTSHKSQVARIKSGYLVISFFLLGASLIYGYYRLSLRPATGDLQPIKVSVIQGNIPQELKWQTRSREFILDRYLTLSRDASCEEPGLVIWPEAAVPGYLFNPQDKWMFERIFNFAKDRKLNFLIGAVAEEGENYFNTAILVDGQGRIIQRYNKLHLVPFGEYIPFKKAFPFLETIVPIGDFTAGREYTVFSLDGTTKFSVLICFEDLFPELSRRFVKKGANFLVNITNDAWFGKTPSPFQHLALSVFRAVENRRFLLRAANTGVSGFIAPNGAVSSLVADNRGKAVFITGYETAFVYPRDNITFYTRFGDIVVLICLILAIYGIINKYRKPRINTHGEK